MKKIGIVFIIILLIATAFIVVYNQGIYTKADKDVKLNIEEFSIEKPAGITDIGVYLSGMVATYDGEYTPVDFKLNNESLEKKKNLVKIPGRVDTQSSKTTLRFSVRTSNFNSNLALRLPMIGKSYKIYYNDTLLEEVIDHKSIKANKIINPYIYERIFILPRDTNPFYITITANTISAEEDIYLREKIFIGSVESVIEKRFLFHTIDYVVIGGLLITAIYTLLLFIVIRNKELEEKATLLLYIFIISGSLALRALLATDLANSLLYALIGRTGSLKLFNVSSDMAFIGAILFLSELYSTKNKPIVTKGFVISYIVIGVIECIFLNSYVATFVNLFNIVAFIYIAYLIYHGFKCEANRFLALGVMLSAALTLYDILYYLVLGSGNFNVRVFSYSSISVYIFIIPSCVLVGMKYVDTILEKKTLLEKNQLISRELISMNNSIDSIVLTRTRELEESVSEIKSEYKKVEELAKKDPLTNLSNRRHFLDILKNAYGGTEKKFTIIIGDIDDFKTINDRYGHNFGDKILKAISTVLRKHTRHVARWGGEEFIICINTTNRNRVENTLKKMMSSIRALKFTYAEEPVSVTMTFGVYMDSDYSNLIKSINNADISLYHGKDSGKDTISYFSELRGEGNV